MNNKNFSKEALKNTAAHVLAQAIVQQFNQARIIQCAIIKNIGFYVDIHFPYPEHEQLLPLLEEKMRQICKQKLEISKKEMLLSNAIDYFKHLDQEVFIEPSFHDNKKVVVLRDFDGHFAVITDEEMIDNTSYLNFFSLLSYEKLSNRIIRIFGIAEQDKEKLKQRKKIFQKYKKNNYVYLGQKFYFLSSLEEKIFLLPKGQLCKQMLCDLFQELMKKEGFSLIQTMVKKKEEKIDFYQKIFSQKKLNKLYEIFCSQKIGEEQNFLNTNHFLSTIECFFVTKKTLHSEIISSLKFIGKILKILGFDACIDFIYTKKNADETTIIRNAFKACLDDYEEKNDINRHLGGVKFYVMDNLQRRWHMSSLQIKKCLSYWMIERTTICSFERLLALFIEKWGEKSLEKAYEICVDYNVRRHFENK